MLHSTLVEIEVEVDLGKISSSSLSWTRPSSAPACLQNIIKQVTCIQVLTNMRKDADVQMLCAENFKDWGNYLIFAHYLNVRSSNLTLKKWGVVEEGLMANSIFKTI